MNSYESSKWYVKIWRKRWYFIIPFLFIRENILKIDWLYYFLDAGFSKKERVSLYKSWFDIKRHVDLTKLKKYS